MSRLSSNKENNNSENDKSSNHPTDIFTKKGKTIEQKVSTKISNRTIENYSNEVAQNTEKHKFS